MENHIPPIEHEADSSGLTVAAQGNVTDLQRVARDPNMPLQKRLLAFEDIYEYEVGDSNLSRARNLERISGLRMLFLKFEGDNPTGTHKDRIAFAQTLDALRRGYETISLATCGNYGVAMAYATHLAGLRCLVVLPEGYHTKRITEMQALGAEIVRAGSDYESAVLHSREMAARDGLYDANPGGENEDLQIRAYKEIAFEIYDELKDAPAVVALPMSNGTVLAGVERGFSSLYRRGKTSRMPKIVGGSAWHKNPIVSSFERGLDRCEDLLPDKIHETEVNEPLVNWHAIDGETALQAIRASGGWAGYATDREMKAAAKLIRDQQGLNTLPAATAGFIALMDQHQRQALVPDRYVVILTGRSS